MARRRKAADGSEPAAARGDGDAAPQPAQDSVDPARASGSEATGEGREPDAGAAPAKRAPRRRTRKPAESRESESGPPAVAEAVGAAESATPATQPAEASGGAGSPAASEEHGPEGSAPRRRRSRGGRGRRRPAGGAPQGATDAPVEAQREQASPTPLEAAPAAAAAEDATGSAEAQETSDQEHPPAKRRRRGSRGGRRHHKHGGAEGQTVEAAEGAPENGAPEPLAAASQAEPAEAIASAGVESAAPAKAAPRRRSRRKTSEPAAGEEQGAEAATVQEPAAAQPVAEPAVQSPAPRRSRGRRRAGQAPVAEAADRADASAPPAESSETPQAGTGAVGESGAGEAAPSESAEGETRRRRSSRGGRRGRGRRRAVLASGEAGVASGRSETEAEVEADTCGPPDEGGGLEPAAEVSETQAAGEPAADEERKVRGRRGDRRRPRAIVRQDEGSGLGTPEAEVAAGGQRRPVVVVEAPKRRIILVTDDGQELRVALIEDGRLAEIYIERPDKTSVLGNIYQGKVDNVLPGIDAAFVDFGLEKNGFLYVDEVLAPDGEKRPRRIAEALKNGQQVLVQVTKDPMGSKGARLSTKISLAGRYLVYVPGGSGVGVSRRLRQSERDRLRDISKDLKPKNAGLIVRTIAEGHGLDDLKLDLKYLSSLWSRLKKKAESVKPPGLVHKEVDISIEAARDLFNDTCESLIVDDAKRHKAIVAFLQKEAPELVPRVHRHTGTEPLFQAYGVEDQIARALERRVQLPNGGNLVIDHAEALTVIDVNTGRFAGGKRLEETITHTNLEAAREVVRQLRLRDIGGIIIIDFIDMAHARNREMVLATLEAELESDRTKTYVVELSPLGLVEMTRQNTTDGARGILTRSCPACLGKARVLSDETVALSVERRLRDLARKSQAKAWLIEVNGGVAERLSGQRLKKLEKETGRRIFVEGASGLPADSFRVLAEGTPAHVQEQRVPVREGQEVEMELEFSLTYSPKEAVGYVDGYMLVVENGRQYLGEKRRVRVTSTTRRGGSATLVAPPKGGGGGGSSN